MRQWEGLLQQKLFEQVEQEKVSSYDFFSSQVIIFLKLLFDTASSGKMFLVEFKQDDQKKTASQWQFADDIEKWRRNMLYFYLFFVYWK